jgi:alanine racemase
MSPPKAIAARVESPSSVAEDSLRNPPSQGSLRVLRPRRAAPDQTVRPTRAEIDLSALRHNLQVVKHAAGTARVWGVLKADGYGHGGPAVARTLERAGIDGLAVALLEEAIELRDAGIRAPILVMGGYYGDAYGELLAHDLVPVVYHRGHLEGLRRAARLAGESTPVRVHVKVDTGMARLGCAPRELPSLLEDFRAIEGCQIDGVMTHFAMADADEAAIAHEELQHQLRRFDAAVTTIRASGHAPRFLHASNSAALFRAHREGRFDRTAIDPRLDAVRPGIGLFGVDPTAQDAATLTPTGGRTLRSTLRMRTEIVAIRTIEIGDAVGYGSTFRATRRTTIATVPMGYADGLPRSLSNCGTMLVRGKRAPIVGAVSMDLCTLDVTDIEGARLRDEAVALGDQQGPLGQERLSVQEVARTAGLIPWDVMTSISRRVPRFFRT